MVHKASKTSLKKRRGGDVVAKELITITPLTRTSQGIEPGTIQIFVGGAQLNITIPPQRLSANRKTRY